METLNYCHSKYSKKSLAIHLHTLYRKRHSPYQHTSFLTGSLNLVYKSLQKLATNCVFCSQNQGEEDRGSDVPAQSGSLPLRHTPGQASWCLPVSHSRGSVTCCITLPHHFDSYSFCCFSPSELQLLRSWYMYWYLIFVRYTSLISILFPVIYSGEEPAVRCVQGCSVYAGRPVHPPAEGNGPGAGGDC